MSLKPASVELSSTPRIHSRGFAIAAVLILLLLSPTGAIAQVNKCDINGRIVYTDQSCPRDSAKKLNLQPLNATSSPPAGSAGGGGYRSSKWYDDHRGYAQALKLSREHGVPIFIYAYTDWCGYCKKLKKGMFSDARVKDTLAGFVKVRLNPEHSAADRELFRRWGGKGYPTLYVQQGADATPARTRGPFTRQNGKWRMMPKAAFISMLENPP